MQWTTFHTARSRARLALVLPALFVLASCGKDNPTTPTPREDRDAYSGGETTIFNATSQAYTFPAPNVADVDRHLAGDVAFDAAFVAAPAPVHGGLGPVFNNTSCVSCHVSNGRGVPPRPGEPPESMLMRLSVPGVNPDGSGGPNPAPGFGAQLNDRALFDVAPEGSVRVTYTDVPGQFADGEPYTLRRPHYAIQGTYTNLPDGLMTSPRIALPVFGRGLLEAIPEDAILAHADEGDADGDGISGRPNYVYDGSRHQTVLGRFGWKANQPTLLQQSAKAYHDDMGVTSPIFDTESAAGQPQDDGAGDEPEIALETVELTAFYTATLAVPARRDLDDPVARRGERLFADAGCATCHTPTFETGVLDGVPSVSNQTIHPYTDMLLHDMGEDLADGRPDYAADGREWRTPPLWGIGLTKIVHGDTYFMHDGRARTLMEAILWHGGEADGAREFVRGLSKADRNALIAFLESL